MDDVYKSFTYGYGPDITKKKYGLQITDGDIIRTWKPEEIMDCYEALGLLCCFNRPDRITLCLYFKDLEQLKEAKRWMKINHPEVQVSDEIIEV